MKIQFISRRSRRYVMHCLLALAVLGAVSACKPSQQTLETSAAGSNAAKAELPSSVAGNPLAAVKGRGFVIRGERLSVPDGTLVAVMTGKVKSAQDAVFKTTVKQGAFTIHGQVDEVQMAGVILESAKDPMGKYAQFILDNEDYVLKDAGSFSSIGIAGGTINDAVYGYAASPAYLADLKRYDDTAARLWKGVDRKNDVLVARAERALAQSGAGKEAQRIREQHQRRTLAGNLPVAKLFLLAVTTNEGLQTEAERAAMLDALERQLGPVPMLTQMQKGMKRQAELKSTRDLLNVGDKYQDISVAGEDGKQVRLSDVLAKNKVVLLDFWASWCGPCREQFPRLKRMYAKHHASGFEIYAVSGDEDAANWRRASKEEKLPWIDLHDANSAPGTKGKSAANSWGVNAFPTNYLVGRDGKILAVNIEREDLERAVEAALKQP